MASLMSVCINHAKTCSRDFYVNFASKIHNTRISSDWIALTLDPQYEREESFLEIPKEAELPKYGPINQENDIYAWHAVAT